MTTQEKVQHITEKVYQANPNKPKIRAYCMVRGHEQHIEEPITIADILLAIGDTGKGMWSVTEYGTFIERIGQYEDDFTDKEDIKVIYAFTNNSWNLSNDSLSYHAEHKPEVIDFIYSILS